MPFKSIFESKRWGLFSYFVLACALCVSIGPSILNDPGEKQLFAHQAQAFLQGRLDIPEWIHDATVFEGRNFCPFPPAPAIVLLPNVALTGLEGTKSVATAVLLTFLSAYVLSLILKKLDLDSTQIRWLVIAFFLGTGYWMVTIRSTGCWFFAHTVAIAGVLLAINEALGKSRAVLVGLFLGIAFLSRQLNVYHSIFLCAALWSHPQRVERKDKIRAVVAFGAAFSLAAVAYLTLNWLRFGNPLDTGYAYVPLKGFLKDRVDQYGLFHAAYIPFNFAYMFLQGFHINFLPPDFLSYRRTDGLGTSLTFASPFVFLAIGARWDKRLLVAGWASVLLALCHMLCYYNNGFYQQNAQRFTLDFFPMLILLVALGVKRMSDFPWLWKGTIAYAVSLNVFVLAIMPNLWQLVTWANLNLLN